MSVLNKFILLPGFHSVARQLSVNDRSAVTCYMDEYFVFPDDLENIIKLVIRIFCLYSGPLWHNVHMFGRMVYQYHCYQF
jgi:hypothetical protein